MNFKEHNEQMALALALSNMGAEWMGDDARTPMEAWGWMLRGLMEAGHDVSEAERIIDGEVRSWLHDVDVAEPHTLRMGTQLLERFAWGG